MIVHIVPTVPPDINGLADYCHKLWQHWPQPRPDWKCVTAHVPEAAASVWPEAEIIPFQLNGPSLTSALDKAGAYNVVLHYVGYAYHPKGVPLWLPSALRTWKTKSRGRLCVMFHEVYSTGSPRHSAFWLSPLARKIIIDLAKITDHWVSSSVEAQQQLIVTHADPGKGLLIPVGANIEPFKVVDGPKPWPLNQGKLLKIALFGLPSTRLSALRKHQNLIALLIARNLVESITLLGQTGDRETAHSTEEVIAHIGHPELWLKKFDLSSQQISEEFFRADVGLVSHRPGLLTKSGVYATFCCHGLVAVSAFETGYSSQSTVPALVNFDDDPEKCANLLMNEAEMEVIKQRTFETARNQLSWASIVGQWSAITA